MKGEVNVLNVGGRALRGWRVLLTMMGGNETSTVRMGNKEQNSNLRLSSIQPNGYHFQSPHRLDLASPALSQSLRPTLHSIRRETPHIPTRDCIPALREPLFASETEFLVLFAAFGGSTTGVSRRGLGGFVGLGGVFKGDVEEVFFVGGARGVGVFAFCRVELC